MNINKIPMPPKAFMSGIIIKRENFLSFGRFYVGEIARRTGIDFNQEVRVLDIGCGPSRLAMGFLQECDHIIYRGFDISKRCIEWAKKHISSKFSNFDYRHIDLHNQMYNKSGDGEAKNLVFPYTDESFDLIVALSVFTHIDSAVTENYIKELKRVMRPDGKAFVTVFLLDKSRLRLARSKKLRSKNYRFVHEFEPGIAWTPYITNPSRAVGYMRDYFLGLIKREGMLAEVEDGTWAIPRSKDHLRVQDMIVITK